MRPNTEHSAGQSPRSQKCVPVLKGLCRTSGQDWGWLDPEGVALLAQGEAQGPAGTEVGGGAFRPWGPWSGPRHPWQWAELAQRPERMEPLAVEGCRQLPWASRVRL